MINIILKTVFLLIGFICFFVSVSFPLDNWIKYATLPVGYLLVVRPVLMYWHLFWIKFHDR